MTNNISYTNIRVILDECTQHELLQDLTLEQIVGYVLKFNGKFNIPELYQEKSAVIDICNYRGELPCDLVSVKQVRDCYTKVALAEISSSFFNPVSIERSFKTQGKNIFTTFREGKIEVVYRAVPTDDEGYPMILDNEIYKHALVLFIKKAKFTNYFDTGKISAQVLQNTQQEYAFAAGQLHAELKMPSLSQWENISNAGEQIVEKPHEFRKGFEGTGNPELYKIHR